MNINIQAVIILIITFTGFQYSVSKLFKVALKSLSPPPLPPNPIPVYIVENPEQPKRLYKAKMDKLLMRHKFLVPVLSYRF